MRDGWRLACQTTIAADAALEVPDACRSPGGKSFGDDTLVPADRVPMPAAAMGGGGAWAAALDIGTTTLAAALIDLRSGRIEAEDTALNPQSAAGPDVMSRILYAGRGAREQASLTGAVRRGVASLIAGLCGPHGIRPGDVAAAAVVGNPTMLHLWRGVDPAGLGVAPFLGQWVEATACRASDVGLPVHPSAEVYVLPAIRSHVGADAVAAAVAVGLDQAGTPAMLIDLGTNSEIVLGDARGAVASSTAAGPAFEGGGVTCGMRAAAGAIDACHVEADGRLSLHVIGGGVPIGLCGAGLLDAVAELRRAGIIDAAGRMMAPDEARDRLPKHLAARVIVNGQGKAFVLAGGVGPHDGVVLAASDVRQAQLAVAAVRAGIDLLCAEARIEPSRIARVWIAGSFGRAVRLRSLFLLGMLPAIDAERVHIAGNAAGVGARLALVDARARDRATAFARRARYVELAGRTDYAEAFEARLRFPDRTRW